MLKFKPVGDYFAKVSLTVLAQILFSTLVTLLLMSTDDVSQKEFTRIKKKFEGVGFACARNASTQSSSYTKNGNRVQQYPAEITREVYRNITQTHVRFLQNEQN